MDEPRTRWSPAALFAIGLLLILIGLSVAAFPTLRFVQNMMRDASVPIAHLDANTETTLTFPDTDTRYVIAQTVESPDDAIGDVGILLTRGHATTEAEGVSGWFTVMGRFHRNVLLLTPPEGLEVTLTLTADDGADFVVFRHPDDAIPLRYARAMRFWAISAVPVLLGFVCVIVGCVRASARIEGSLRDL